MRPEVTEFLEAELDYRDVEEALNKELGPSYVKARTICRELVAFHELGQLSAGGLRLLVCGLMRYIAGLSDERDEAIALLADQARLGDAKPVPLVKQ